MPFLRLVSPNANEAIDAPTVSTADTTLCTGSSQLVGNSHNIAPTVDVQTYFTSIPASMILPMLRNNADNTPSYIVSSQLNTATPCTSEVSPAMVGAKQTREVSIAPLDNQELPVGLNAELQKRKKTFKQSSGMEDYSRRFTRKVRSISKTILDQMNEKRQIPAFKHANQEPIVGKSIKTTKTKQKLMQTVKIKDFLKN